MTKKILTLPEAARETALNRVTLWKYAKSGDLKAYTTPGGHYRILREDLEAFMRRKGIYPFGPYQPEIKKILIVDDDPATQKMLTKIMSRQGYQTEIATDGFEAGAKVMKFKPGLIILDLIMPGMDGFQVCKKIKGNPDTSHIKILAVTGYDTDENRDRIMEAGADGYLPKPIESDLLFQRVRSLLNGPGEEQAFDEQKDAIASQ